MVLRHLANAGSARAHPMRGTKHVRQAQASACGPCCFLHTARYRIRPGFRRPRVLIITPIQRPPPSQCRRKLTPRVLLLLQNPRASRLSACSPTSSLSCHFPVAVLWEASWFEPSICLSQTRPQRCPSRYVRAPDRSTFSAPRPPHARRPPSPRPRLDAPTRRPPLQPRRMRCHLLSLSACSSG